MFVKKDKGVGCLFRTEKDVCVEGQREMFVGHRKMFV